MTGTPRSSLGDDDESGQQRWLTRTVHCTKRQAEMVLTKFAVEDGHDSNLDTAH
ncbi:MAG: hypothetical protein WBA31_01555 [Candidatus Dormiibacterota bacterium]